MFVKPELLPLLFLCLQLSVASITVGDEKTDDQGQTQDTESRSTQPSDYELMATFVEAFQQVESNYVRDVDRRQLMEAAIQGMLNNLDQYSNYITPEEVPRFNQMVEQEFGGIGIQVNVRNGKLVIVSPLPDSPAYSGGLRSGDIIQAVDGKTMEGATLDGAIKELQGPIGRPVTVRYLKADSGVTEEITLVRQLIKAPTVRGDHYVDGARWDFVLPGSPKIGYVRVSHFSRFTADEVRTVVQELIKEKISGLVIDLRFNPGGLLEVAIEMSDMFLEQGSIVSVRGRNVSERTWEASPKDTFPQFPMAVLVNNYSASASEVFSACLQDNKRAVIVGERTWGKGSVQNVIRMGNGSSALKLTTATYHRPSGVNIHRFPDMKPDDNWGVTPDEGFEIPYTRQMWTAWDRDRSQRDALRREVAADSADSADAVDANTAVAENDAEAVFKDAQLLAAVEYIKAQLQDAAVVKSKDGKSVTKPVSDAKPVKEAKPVPSTKPEPVSDAGPDQDAVVVPVASDANSAPQPVVP